MEISSCLWQMYPLFNKARYNVINDQTFKCSLTEDFVDALEAIKSLKSFVASIKYWLRF